MKQKFDEEHDSLYEFNNGLAKIRREWLKNRKFRTIAFVRALKMNKKRELIDFSDVFDGNRKMADFYAVLVKMGAPHES